MAKATKKKAVSRAARPRNINGVKKTPRKKAAPKDTTLAVSDGEADKPVKAPKAAAIKKSRGAADIDPLQKELPIIEQTDRIPAIERVMKDYVEAESRQKKAGDDMKLAVDKLPGLFKKHKTADYTCLGRTAELTHGPDVIKFKRASTK